MAVANTKSTNVSNADSSAPHTPSAPYLSGGGVKVSLATVEVAAADDDASVYRMVRLPSNAVILRIEVLNDAITAGTDYDVGLYQTAVEGGAVASGNLFASSIDMSIARTLPLDCTFENLGIEKIEYRLWELLGLSSDPQRGYDLSFRANTVGSAAGTLSMRVIWTV